MFRIDGAKVWNYLLSRGLTNKKFAKIAGISTPTVRNIIKGKSSGIMVLHKVAKAMNVKPQDLILKG